MKSDIAFNVVWEYGLMQQKRWRKIFLQIFHIHRWICIIMTGCHRKTKVKNIPTHILYSHINLHYYTDAYFLGKLPNIRWNIKRYNNYFPQINSVALNTKKFFSMFLKFKIFILSYSCFFLFSLKSYCCFQSMLNRISFHRKPFKILLTWNEWRDRS